jgi:hypothetical protein
MPMEVLCLEDAALYALVEEVTARIQEKFNKPDKWISAEEAMKKLNITIKNLSRNNPPEK